MTVWSRTRSAGEPIGYRNNDASLIELVGNQIPDDRGQIPPYSSSGIRALDGRAALRAPRLSLWGSERWDAMFGSVGWRIHCAFTKSTTGLSRAAVAHTVSTNASCRSRCSSDSSLKIRGWGRSPPSYVVANAGCGEHVFAQNMSAQLEMGASAAPDGEFTPLDGVEFLHEFTRNGGVTPRAIYGTVAAWTP